MSEIRLMASAEAAECLRISTSYLSRLTREDRAFPSPIATLRVGKIWRAEDIERYRDRRLTTSEPRN